MDTNLILSEDSRKKLDGIVQQMIANKESDANIQAVVNDFKQKYSTAPEAPAPAPEEKSVLGFGKNVVKSAGNIVGGLISLVAHPVKSAENIGRMALGGAEDLSNVALGTKFNDKNTEAANAVGQFYKNRYGGLKNIGNTLYEDPLGVAADAATFLSGGGALAAKAGQFAKLGKVAELADIAKAGDVADIANVMGKAGEATKIAEAANDIQNARKLTGINVADRIARNAGTPAVKTALRALDLKNAVKMLGPDKVAEFIGKTGIPEMVPSKLEQVGNLMKTAGQTIDPVAGMFKMPGKALEKLTAGKKIAPFAGKVDTETLSAANKLGVDVPASAVTNSRVVPLIESAVAKGFFGSKIADKIENAKTALSNIADDVVKSTGQSGDLTIVGKKLSEGFDKYRTAWMKTKNELYQQAEKLAGEKQVPVQAQNTTSFLKNVIGEKMLASKASPVKTDIKFFQDQLKKLNRKNLTFTELRSAVKELNDRVAFGVDPVITGNKAILRKMITSMSDDLDTAVKASHPQLAQAIDTANTYYKTGLDKMNSAFGKKISAFKNQPDKILPAVLNPSTSIEDIPRIMEVVGRENTPAVQAGVLNEMFKNARNTQGVFTPTGLAREIKNFGEDKLKAILTPEQFDKVKNIERVARAGGKLDKVAAGSQTAFLLRSMLEGGALFSNPVLFVKTILGDVAASRFFGSPTGQKLLTTGIGLTGKTGKALQNFGTKTGRYATPGSVVGKLIQAVNSSASGQ